MTRLKNGDKLKLVLHEKSKITRICYSKEDKLRLNGIYHFSYYHEFSGFIFIKESIFCYHPSIFIKKLKNKRK